MKHLLTWLLGLFETNNATTADNIFAEIDSAIDVVSSIAITLEGGLENLKDAQELSKKTVKGYRDMIEAEIELQEAMITRGAHARTVIENFNTLLNVQPVEEEEEAEIGDSK